MKVGCWVAACALLAPGVLAVDMDFGDAPTGFPVTIAENGARHDSATSLRMGAARNIEPDGTHFANSLSPAEADDGVTGPLSWPKESLVVLSVVVSTNCRLDAWVDWSGNRSWSGTPDDAADRIASSLLLAPGTNALPVFVPRAATNGITFARFRVSTAGLLEPTGTAADGEVEDYPLNIVTNAQPADVPVAVGRTASNRVALSWTGSSNYSAQVASSTDLATWKLSEVPFAESSGTNTFIVPAPLTDGAGTLRVQRQPLYTMPVPTAPGFYKNLTFVHGGIARMYYLKIPTNWNGAQNWPIAMLLHGHGQSAEEFSSRQAEIIAQADQRGWLLVFPDGTTENVVGRWFCYDDPNTAAPPHQGTQPYLDDPGFILALVNHLQHSGLKVDPARVYAAGFSNGGSLCYEIASRTNHPFAAFAFVETGVAPIAFYPTPYDRDAPTTGSLLPALVPPPAAPRPVLLMNMVTSIPWVYEGTPIGSNGLFLGGARHGVARWTQINGFGSVTQVPPIPALPVAPLIKLTNTWTAAGTNRAPCRYDAMRADEGWPAALLTQTNWTLALALNFPYGEPKVPAALRAEYPHILSPDPQAVQSRILVDQGTMTVEYWRTAPLNRTNEVIAVTLSDGGHAWPGVEDKLPFNANLSVLDFFEAH